MQGKNEKRIKAVMPVGVIAQRALKIVQAAKEKSGENEYQYICLKCEDQKGKLIEGRWQRCECAKKAQKPEEGSKPTTQTGESW